LRFRSISGNRPRRRALSCAANSTFGCIGAGQVVPCTGRESITQIRAKAITEQFIDFRNFRNKSKYNHPGLGYQKTLANKIDVVCRGNETLCETKTYFVSARLFWWAWQLYVFSFGNQEKAHFLDSAKLQSLLKWWVKAPDRPRARLNRRGEQMHKRRG
jgi:hypothetical protein